MKRVMLPIVLVLVLSGTSFAGLLSLSSLELVGVLANGEDVFVDVGCTDALEDLLADDPIIDESSQLVYWLQEEGVHGTITQLTGESIDHYYIWVRACGYSIPIDPMWID